jgi:hypothetical protein
MRSARLSRRPVEAFAHLGGVPRRYVYENVAAAVRKIVGARRELTGLFLALVSHYLLEPDFARIGARALQGRSGKPAPRRSR